MTHFRQIVDRSLRGKNVVVVSEGKQDNFLIQAYASDLAREGVETIGLHNYPFDKPDQLTHAIRRERPDMVIYHLSKNDPGDLKRCELVTKELQRTDLWRKKIPVYVIKSCKWRDYLSAAESEPILKAGASISMGEIDASSVASEILHEFRVSKAR